MIITLKKPPLFGREDPISGGFSEQYFRENGRYLTRSCQNATALAAATFRESTL